MDNIVITLSQPATELYKILKFSGLTASGAEAKLVIAQGLVIVNEVVETRKRKKIYAGDHIVFNGQRLEIH